MACQISFILIKARTLKVRTILCQTLDAFGITKLHTTAYHPAGDGLVECFSRSLLQMLCAYVFHQTDRKKYFPLVLELQFIHQLVSHLCLRAVNTNLRFLQN